MTNLLYPADWPQLAREIKEANHWRCIACEKQCRRPGEMNLGWEYELGVAHICQDYEAEAVYVAPLCGRCHLLHDSTLVWVARRRQSRIRQRVAGQLEINYSSR